MTSSIAYIDSSRMLRGLRAGIQHLFHCRENIDRINVFPVPDGDTGTNLAFSFKVILEALTDAECWSVKKLMSTIADASLDGSRGNSGAIMAQYFHGFHEALAETPVIYAHDLAQASLAGARLAWTAMSKPVAGTLPTVLEDFSTALERKTSKGEDDILAVFEYGLLAARKSLASTPDLLPVLHKAGVVDAGGQGFVDLLEGIWALLDRGEVDVGESPSDHLLPSLASVTGTDNAIHRFCTECVIEGDALDRIAIMKRLEQLDCSSLVVAGGQKRVRVHIHLERPGEAFLACESFGSIHQQKADDMQRQHSLMNQPGQVAVVTDSGADIPHEELERLGMHMVSARLNFAGREYIDHVSLLPADLYRMLGESDELPKTSQPPVGDFSRQYELLTSHGYRVMSVGLSSGLSGTTAAARMAASKFDGKVRVFDTESASSGEGVLAVVAAEAAQQGLSLQQIEALLTSSQPLTRTYAIPADLSYIVAGGRLPAWVKVLADFLHIAPLLTAKKGRFKLAGLVPGRGATPSALGKMAIRQMERNTVYRILIAHGVNPEGARQLRRYILARHTLVHSCHITEAGPALGVHLGPGGLVVGFLPQPSQLN